MINFTVLEGDYLVSFGTAPSEEDLPSLLPGQSILLNVVHKPTSNNNKSGERWNVKKNKWEDVRSNQEKQAAKAFEIQAARYSEYPSLNDLADALYHQHKGDKSKLEDYFAKCEAVKIKQPKPIE